MPTVREMREAIEACDDYFSGCARSWASNEGRVVNEDGVVVVEADGLDELCQVAAAKVATLVERLRDGEVVWDEDESPGIR